MAKIQVICRLCGKRFMKDETKVRENNFCGAAHLRQWNAMRMSEYNRSSNPLNKPGSVLSSRKKHHVAFKGTGEGKAYRKFFGRHEHRAIAEAMLGRSLLPGEVVHHIDGNKLNNDPINLEILSSQSEHTRFQHRDPQGRWCK